MDLLLDRLTFIVELLAGAKPHFDFHEGILEIETQRDQGPATGIQRLNDFADLMLVQQ